MSHSKLIFFPKKMHLTASNEQIINIISELKFIQPEVHTTNHYLPGDAFLSLLTFMGCSPNINLVPTPNEAHCFVSLVEASNEEKCLGYTRTCNPKCPTCTKRIANWKIDNWQQSGKLCHCDKCGADVSYAELNWKQECGFGRCGFEVAHIYPHEAIPGDQLLTALQQHTGFEWQYCYANN